MLTIPNYHPVSYRPNFKCKLPASNVNELTSSSKKLLDNIYRIMKSNSPKSVPNIPVRSKRFADGSFVELQNKSQALNIKYLRMNRRPVEMNIKQDGSIEYNNNLTEDLNGIIEKYIPDIIEREQFKYIM